MSEHFLHHPGRGAETAVRLSVIIPAYNAAPYLDACLTSLLTQAPADLEIIVVNDGSHDNTAEIAAARAADDARIRVITQSNAGVSAARNTGLSQARGIYVCFIDADDEVEPGWAAALLSAGELQHPAIIKGEACIVEQGAARELTGVCQAMISQGPLHWFGWMWSALYRRSFLASHGLCFVPGHIYAEDAAFQVRTLLTAYLAHERIAVCPAAVYRYMRREGSMDSPVLNERKVACALETYTSLHALLYRKQCRLPPSALIMQYSTWIRNLYGIARRAERPADRRAAASLALRLRQECPVSLTPPRREAPSPAAPVTP